MFASQTMPFSFVTFKPINRSILFLSSLDYSFDRTMNNIATQY